MNRVTSVMQTALGGSNAVAPKLVTQAYYVASQLTDMRRYSATTANPAALKVHSRLNYDGAGRNTSTTQVRPTWLHIGLNPLIF